MIGINKYPAKVGIKNIGRLDDVEILLNRFTVFAGSNNTGKSFASKLIYSLLSSISSSHPPSEIYRYTMGSFIGVALVVSHFDKVDNKSKSSVKWFNKLKLESERVYSWNNQPFDRICEYTAYMLEITENLVDLLSNIPEDMVSNKYVMSNSESIEETLIKLSGLKKKLTDITTDSVVTDSIFHKLLNFDLVTNFQVDSFYDIANCSKEHSELSISGLGKFTFLNKNATFDFENLSESVLELYHRMYRSRAIYLESPIYWKLYNLLEISSTFIDGKDDSSSYRSSGLPNYFSDLQRALKYNYSGEIEFPEVYEELVSKNLLGGKVSITPEGDISFQEGARSYSMHSTSTGIINFGILALLIEKKVLNKGAFLFVDEPESNLHPAWQVRMAEILFKLAKQGLNVVISTHSVDILKWLEVHIKNNPDDEEIVALNQFPVKNDSLFVEDFKTRIAKIKQELTEPFTNLYIRGI